MPKKKKKDSVRTDNYAMYVKIMRSVAEIMNESKDPE